MDLIVKEIIELVKKSRSKVAVSVNAELTILYWQIGSHIKQTLLNDARAEYGKNIIKVISANLTAEYGKGWSERHLWNCTKFYDVFPDSEIVHTLCAELTWSHFRILCTIDNNNKRFFYSVKTKEERWSVRELDTQIDKMLFERTTIAAKPEDIINNELNLLQNQQEFSPDLIFKNTYVLDFLGLSSSHSETELENAILNNIQTFIMEMGKGFAFVERQKRISVDGTDYHLDLLFYHRKLKSLVAVDLKLGKFKPKHKGQMELYLNWLEKYEMQQGENPPIGLLLCSEGNTEHIELMMLNQTEIRVAQYLTELPSKEWFMEKLHRAIEIANINKIQNL